MAVGDRSADTCRTLWEAVPEAYKSLTTYSDFWQAYCSVVPKEQHQRCRKGSGLTNTIERFNLTLRQRVPRLIRKTLSFSKCWQMHLICLRIFLDRYNKDCLKRFRKDITDNTMLKDRNAQAVAATR